MSALNRYSPEAAERIAAAMVASGIDFAVFLPCGVLHAVDKALEAHPAVTVLNCAREDEGIAIGVGASLAGRRVAVLMEGSGVGYSGLILARALAVNRAEVMLVVSHNTVLGERFHYHGATRAVTEPVLTALHVPYHVLQRLEEADHVFPEIAQTMSGQRTPVAVLIPRPLCVAR